MMQCPRCGTVVPPNARFCDSCGMPLPAGAVAVAPPPLRAPAGTGGKPPWPQAATRRTVNTVLAAASVAWAGFFLLVGAITPFAAADGSGESFRLVEGNGGLAVVVIIAAVVCVSACVGEFLRFRDGLIAGAGLTAAIGSYAATATLAHAFLSDGSGPSVGAVAWLLAVLGAVVVVVLFSGDVLRNTERPRSPVAFAGCSLGGGILATLALLLPAEGVAFDDHLFFHEPAVTLLVLVHACVPALVGALSMAARDRAMHQFTFGVAAWHTLEWAQRGSAYGSGGASRFLLGLALLILGVSSIGGGFVRWRGQTATFLSARDYALPITSVAVFVLVLLAGLIA